MQPESFQDEPFHITRTFPCGYTEMHKYSSGLLHGMLEGNLVPDGQDITSVSVILRRNSHCRVCRNTDAGEELWPLCRHTYICKHDKEFVISAFAIKGLQYHGVIPPGHEKPLLLVAASYCDGCQATKLNLLRSCLARSADIDIPPTQPGKTTLRTHLRAAYDAHLTGKLPCGGYVELLDIAAQACIHLIPEEGFHVWVKEGRFDEYIIRDLQKAIKARRQGNQKQKT